MLRRSICRRGPKGFADFTTPATDQCVLLEWYNESLAPRVRKGTAGQTEPRERLTMGKGKFKKGISDENDDEIQASHPSVTVDPLRRTRHSFSRRMCAGAVRDGVRRRLLSGRSLHGILVL